KSQFIEMFGDPVKNDKNLGQKNLSALGKLERGVSKFRPRNAPELLDGPYPLVQTGDVANCDIYITNYNSTYSEIGLRQSKLWPSGTLCITIAANIAKTGILTFDACFPDSIVGFIPDKDVDILYIHFWFKMIQQHIENLAPSTAQKNINLSVLSNLKVICPPISDQKKFSKILEQADKSKYIN
ncbi:MAG: restriction endonuclease subunit S, partial [Prevotella sp.]|nr:restriction endonuclease subunit S [Prevotella sp.]